MRVCGSMLLCVVHRINPAPNKVGTGEGRRDGERRREGVGGNGEEEGDEERQRKRRRWSERDMETER